MSPTPELRAARDADIPRLMEIRAAVRENRLVDRAIGAADYRPYVEGGCCWVWEEAGAILGFAALDARTASVWALFVDPDAEDRGIGRLLLARLVEEGGRRGLAALTLNTAEGTRAAAFYRAAGWQALGLDGGERLFRLAL
ncbi:MAG TPA: GNAT family N-acetyltransferase [Allosphingosinicella sp.]|nr:GNAT family N-acetyltransferase [Allosphingosinicella sp.]